MRVLRLCSVFEAPTPSLRSSATFDVVGGMQVHTARLTAALDDLDIEQEVITAYRPDAPREQRIGRHAIVRRVGMPVRHLRQLYGIAAIPEVMRVPRPDVVHVHLGADVAIGPLARWTAGRARAPIVATVHCSLRHTIVPHGARSALLRSVGGSMQLGFLRAADAVHVLTERAAELLVGSGMPRSRIRVVALGVDLDAPGSAPRPVAMDPRPWAVYAGRLAPEKGVRDLVEAVGRHLPGIGLVIVGDGPDRPLLEAATARLDAADRIRFVGALPHAEVQPYLRHAHVVVMPSLFEERGRVLLEAMAAGRATASTQPLSSLVRATPDTYRAVLDPAGEVRLPAAEAIAR